MNAVHKTILSVIPSRFRPPVSASATIFLAFSSESDMECTIIGSSPTREEPC